MAIIVKPFTFSPGTIIRSAQVNADFDTLYSDYNGNIVNANIAPGAAIAFSKLAALPSAQIIVGNAGNVPTAVTMSGDATISNTGVVTITGASIAPIIAASQYIAPIGSMTWFFDYGGLVTFDTNSWRYLDGTVLAYPASPLNGQTLQDLSGRYIVGFGTDGGGDIDTAPWALGAVGNAGHQINIAHTHNNGSHDHGAGSFVAAAHNHTAPPISGLMMQSAPGAGGEYNLAGGMNLAIDFTSPLQGDHAHSGFGNTGTAGPHAVSGTSASGGVAATSSSLSATQSIQPRSIRARAIIRVL